MPPPDLTPAVVSLLVALVFGGCVPDEHRWDPEAGSCDGPNCTPGEPPPCFATLCLAGAGYELSDGNTYLEELCAELPGPVSSCTAEGCATIFYDPGKAFDAAAAIVEEMNAGAPIFGATATRAECQLALVGHSWGAFDAADVAARLAADDRPGFRVDRLVALDPYRVPTPAALDVPPSVRAARDFFHSSVTPEDCSALWGGFAGRSLRCGVDQDCRQWDFGGGLDSSGHCGLVIETSGWTRYWLRYGDDVAPPDRELDVERR